MEEENKENRGGARSASMSTPEESVAAGKVSQQEKTED